MPTLLFLFMQEVYFTLGVNLVGVFLYIFLFSNLVAIVTSFNKSDADLRAALNTMNRYTIASVYINLMSADSFSQRNVSIGRTQVFWVVVLLRCYQN